jgi:hypothetical protein
MSGICETLGAASFLLPHSCPFLLAALDGKARATGGPRQLCYFMNGASE